MQTTRKEVLEAMKDLENAMLYMVEISNQEENIKLNKIKGQKRLTLARDLVRSLNF